MVLITAGWNQRSSKNYKGQDSSLGIGSEIRLKTFFNSLGNSNVQRGLNVHRECMARDGAALKLLTSHHEGCSLFGKHP